jgi:hypothetical protein
MGWKNTRSWWRIIAFREPKSGSSGEECDDAYAIEPDVRHEPVGRGLRLAVADGASVGFFSREWADALVGQYIRDPLEAGADGTITPTELQLWLRGAISDLQMAKERTIAARLEQGLPVARMATRSVSHSTFVAARFLHEDGTTVLFEAVAVGDSCVIWRVGPDDQISSFPIADAEAFGNHPNLVPSSLDASTVPLMQVQRFKVGHDGCIILATDAVAKWLLSRHADGYDELSTLMRQTPAGWSQYVAIARSQGMIDDDATAIVLQIVRTNGSVLRRPRRGYRRRLANQPAFRQRRATVKRRLSRGVRR